MDLNNQDRSRSDTIPFNSVLPEDFPARRPQGIQRTTGSHDLPGCVPNILSGGPQRSFARCASPRSTLHSFSPWVDPDASMLTSRYNTTVRMPSHNSHFYPTASGNMFSQRRCDIEMPRFHLGVQNQNPLSLPYVMPLQHYSPPQLPPPLMFPRIPLPFTFDEQFDISTDCFASRQLQGSFWMEKSQAGSALPHSPRKSPSEVLIHPSQHSIPKTPLPIDLSNPKRKKSDNVFVNQQQGAFSPPVQHLPVTLVNSFGETRYNQEHFNDHQIRPEPISSQMRSENAMVLGSGSSHLAEHITGGSNPFSTGNRNSKSETVHDDTFTAAQISRIFQGGVSDYNRQNTIALLKEQIKKRSQQNLNSMQDEIPRNSWLRCNYAMEYENMCSCVDQERKHLGLESSMLGNIDSPQSIKPITSPAEVPINPCQHVSSMDPMDLSYRTQGRSGNVFVNRQIRALYPTYNICQ